MKKAAAVFLLVTASVLAQTPPSPAPPPFSISNPKQQKFPIHRASRLYWYAVYQIARADNPGYPKKLHPDITLALGSEQNSLELSEGRWTIHLVKWDEQLFAIGVCRAAAWSLLNDDQVGSSARSALLFLHAMTDEDELREESR